tara:strand:+ start:549 stop:758 length:210 start_codon:yes stop_codon:yes gene_type:complete
MKQETNNKSMFMIYKNNHLIIKEFECLDDARHFVINYYDQSHEIIVRQIDWVSLRLKNYLDLNLQNNNE